MFYAHPLGSRLFFVDHKMLVEAVPGWIQSIWRVKRTKVYEYNINDSKGWRLLHILDGAIIHTWKAVRSSIYGQTSQSVGNACLAIHQVEFSCKSPLLKIKLTLESRPLAVDVADKGFVH